MPSTNILIFPRPSNTNPYLWLADSRPLSSEIIRLEFADRVFPPEKRAQIARQTAHLNEPPLTQEGMESWGKVALAWRRDKMPEHLGLEDRELLDAEECFEGVPHAGGAAVNDSAQPPNALEAWVARTGADKLNFHRYAVRQLDGEYYRERSVLSIRDGKVKFNGDPADEPTKEEREAIEAAIPHLALPKSVLATKAQADHYGRLLGADDAHWYPIYDVPRTEVIMCLQRIDREDGKDYIPHALFSDGEWRKMEPDGMLPFWKPPAKRKRPFIMMHEGAKAAAYIDWLCNNELREAREARAAHPWFDELQFYEHWGMLGGAYAASRANYDELKKANPRKVVYVCDRDRPGEAALRDFSRHYREPLTGIMFDRNFPLAWDLADPLPECVRNKDGFSHRTLFSYARPATWATDVLKTEGRGRPPTILRPAFAAKWFHATEGEAYINEDFLALVKFGDGAFNDFIAPFSDTKDVASLIKKDLPGKVDSLTFDPSQPQGLITTPEGRRLYNTVTPSLLKPKEGDAAPFWEFMEGLITIEKDREETVRWMATLSECPSIRMHYGLLLFSKTQGIGKTTLNCILKKLVGEVNTRCPDADTVRNPNWTDWKERCRLILVEEIADGHGWALYNGLKSLLTDPTMEIKRRFVSSYTVPNWTHISASTNHESALKMSRKDRRWLIPKLNEQPRDASYWRTFYAWLEHGGYGIIKRALGEWLKVNAPVRPGDHAPMTENKRAVIEAARDDEETAVADALRKMMASGRKCSYPEKCADFLTCSPEDRKKEGMCDRALCNRKDCAGVIVTSDGALEKVVVEKFRAVGKSCHKHLQEIVRRVAEDEGWGVGERRHRVTYPGPAKDQPQIEWARPIVSDPALAGKTFFELKVLAEEAETKVEDEGRERGELARFCFFLDSF